MNEMINCKEAAKVARVSQRTILRAINAHEIVAVKLGEGKTCSYMISRTSIAEYIHRRGRR
ncbi:hypothetical protein PAT3040_00715 [Paenibacillus agaridevorans]|uniref:Helix-turn-helix domain-containing protein n=1 Tax=Paenibacillus agaridevorans TaxID=171404 RepID=A0A2R5EHZ4_9BACL|nr:hypothetical protein PAT3040_00715 [Paenibacillus agaridevorans]